ncbi:finTRIM family, member 86 isoform X3 [Perca fluviatilis]|uniref:finTRIM family, member 86 isoform X3 n=1 Tax=Perca fluviatilis TaxID=8168 RepID=UPI001963BC78|nr:finTRIM family, member 86 isoform X3 [Perca fluviatilis]
MHELLMLTFTTVIATVTDPENLITQHHMASAWSVEETLFVCSVCLDTLKDPATLPCGHSYCLACIQSHWDTRNHKGQYSCPQCRQVFNPRPSLAKSTVLVEAMEKLRTNSLKQSLPSMPSYLDVLPDIGPRQGSMYPELPTVEPRPCPQHHRPMDLFCHEDKECVCEVCCQHEHKGHRVFKTQEERKERQKELLKMQVDMQKRIQETEKRLVELPHVARQHKALVQALERESTDLFSELVNNVNLTGIQVGEVLSTHETSLGSRVEGQIYRLEHEVAPLRWKSEELSRLASMQDDICFLKNFLIMETLQTGATGESILSQEEAVVASVRSALKELQESIQDVCKATLAKIVTLVNPDPVVSTPNGAAVADTTAANNSGQATTQDTDEDSSKHPHCLQASAPPSPFPPPQPQAAPVTTMGLANSEPKTREELLKFRFEPTMDANTVYRHVQLSDGGHKATMRAENLNLPDHPERFHFWRQVLCKEPLAGSPYYWEVEWTGKKVDP